MDKRGFVKTIEVIFAIVITFIFLVYVVPDRFISRPKEQTFDYLAPLEMNPQFREEVLNRAEGCYTDDNTTMTLLVDEMVPQAFNYTLCVSEDPFYLGEELPSAKVSANSFVISNSSETRVVRLFYWVEPGRI